MSLNQQDVLEIMKNRHAVALNVLPKEEFQRLHIEGSKNVPWTLDRGAFVQEVEKQFGKEMFLIVHGSNITSRAGIDATEALRRDGFKGDVFLSGMKGWVEAGLPTAGTQSRPPLSTRPQAVVRDP
ncbi:MAG TPA: rhodanese-like domain-containing protein [bacterium]|nr:rhodanese-like domain-containing protein [bacterium]